MIKKVSSWVLGSFFRQFGRFLFFLVLGGLVFLLIQHNDINFKWTDLLGIETVKADSYYQKWDTIWYDDENLTTMWSPGTTFMYKSFTAQTVFNGNLNLFQVYSSNKIDFNTIKGGHITIPFVIDSPEHTLDNWSNFIINNAVCSAYAPLTGGGYYCTQWDDISTSSYSNPITYSTKVELNVMVRYTSGYNDVCEIDFNTNYISCPIINNTGLTFDGLIIAIKGFNQGSNVSYRLGLGDKVNGWFNDSYSTQQAIESQTNQTIDYFNDTNTTSDVGKADNFFSDTNSTSESALSDIVSTPLTLLNNLSTGTFNDICATLNNKQICLPSGDIIWNRQHGGAGVHDHWFRGGSTDSFITFFNLVVGGFILYKCLISLFHSVHKMLDPAQTYVEVMKL